MNKEEIKERIEKIRWRARDQLNAWYGLGSGKEDVMFLLEYLESQEPMLREIGSDTQSDTTLPECEICGSKENIKNYEDRDNGQVWTLCCSCFEESDTTLAEGEKVDDELFNGDNLTKLFKDMCEYAPVGNNYGKRFALIIEQLRNQFPPEEEKDGFESDGMTYHDGDTNGTFTDEEPDAIIDECAEVVSEGLAKEDRKSTCQWKYFGEDCGTPCYKLGCGGAVAFNKTKAQKYCPYCGKEIVVESGKEKEEWNCKRDCLNYGKFEPCDDADRRCSHAKMKNDIISEEEEK